MPSARLPCSAIFFEIAGQHPGRLVDFGTRVVVERRDARRRRSLQFTEQFDREAGKVVDKVERVLDLVCDAGSQLTE